MEGRAEALVLWLQSATEIEIKSILQVRNCQLLEQLLSRIEGLEIRRTTISSEWRENYAKLKNIYDEVDKYLKDTLKISPPSNLSTVNLIEIAKGESEDGLEVLLHLVFIVCIRCPAKDTFIHCIMKLPSHAQMELMQIIQDWQTFEQEIKEQDSQIAKYKQQITRLEFINQNLDAENISLRAVLDEDNEKVRRNDEHFFQLQRENEQLFIELSEKKEQLRVREENFIDKYAQHNEDIVQQLKKELYEKQSKHGREMLNLKQTVQSLQEALAEAKRQINQLQDMQSRRSIIQSRDEHLNCISIEKHKMKVNELLAQSKEATQKEISLKLENIQIKNLNAELESKLKKIMEQNRKKETEFMISTQDSSKLKIQFFSRIRDSLKQKFMDYKCKDNRSGSGNNIDFLDEI